MILMDTGALYALIDRNDRNHTSAKKYYGGIARQDILAVSLPILTEAWLLIDARIGSFFANKLLESSTKGVFEILEIDRNILNIALEIDRKYKQAGFGFVDCTCFALCEKFKMKKVFTYDRKHFGIFSPTFTRSLELVP